MAYILTLHRRTVYFRQLPPTPPRLRGDRKGGRAGAGDDEALMRRSIGFSRTLHNAGRRPAQPGDRVGWGHSAFKYTLTLTGISSPFPGNSLPQLHTQNPITGNEQIEQQTDGPEESVKWVKMVKSPIQHAPKEQTGQPGKQTC